MSKASLLAEINEKMDMVPIFSAEPGDMFEIISMQPGMYTHAIFLATKRATTEAPLWPSNRAIHVGDFVHVFSNMLILKRSLDGTKVPSNPGRAIAPDREMYEYNLIFKLSSELAAEAFVGKRYKPELALIAISDRSIDELIRSGPIRKIGKVSNELLEYAIKPLKVDMLADIIEK